MSYSVTQFLSYPKNRPNGFSLIEGIVATGTLMIFLVASIKFTAIWKQNNDISKVSSTAIALESAILSAIASPATYANGTLKERLTSDRANRVAVSTITNEDFTLNLDEGLENGIAALPLGTKIYLNESLENCGADFDDSNCLISIEVRFKRIGSEYRFGYDVSTNPILSLPSQTTVELETLPSGEVVWSDESFIVPIPQLYYRHNENRVGICDPATTIGITGIDRDTGDVQCLNIQNGGGCGAGFPIGITASGGSLRMTCSGPPGLSYCPDNYAISRFSPLGNATGAPDRSCRRVVMPLSPGPSFGGAENDNFIYGEACPPTTISESQCVAATVRGIVGTCVPLSCSMPDPMWVDPTPLDPFDNSAPIIAVDCPPLTVTPGTANILEGGRNVICAYTPPARQQTCEDFGGTSLTLTDYVGAAQLNIRCRATLPENP